MGAYRFLNIGNGTLTNSDLLADGRTSLSNIRWMIAFSQTEQIDSRLASSVGSSHH